jgi:hypothetical protein
MGDNIKMNLQEVGFGHGLDLSGSEKGQVAGSCECGNEYSDSIKCGEILD